ncbi:MAG: alternative ribosome rescue aminoacyl-tRNA hydrolase ArfB [Acidobacteriota bacterium]|nr:alternative ribosome rescue aminoacyl-tRNA hydrolase ArfB [Acidobacteriota bacterium]
MTLLYTPNPRGSRLGRVKINQRVYIPEDELSFTASRSSGPGGQNINKVATRITLLFDLENSPSLSRVQKTRIKKYLGARINNQGVLRVICQSHRRQAANRREALERFSWLMADALLIQRVRKKTKVPRAAKKRRREEKQQRSQLKHSRSGVEDWNE